MLCFAEKVPNGRTANVGEPFYFCASAPNQCEALVLFLPMVCLAQPAFVLPHFHSTSAYSACLYTTLTGF